MNDQSPMKRYLKYIIFNALALVATCAIVYFARQHEPAWAVLPEIAWVVIVAGANLFMIFHEPRDMRYDLGKAASHGPYAAQLATIERAYAEVLAREDIFAKADYEGPISHAYSLIRKQLESNVTSALEIADTYTEGRPAGSRYMDELADYSEQLAQRQAQLVEQAIRLRSMKEDVDTSFVTDYIRAMDEVLQSDDLQTDEIAAKYRAKEGEDD